VLNSRSGGFAWELTNPRLSCHPPTPLTCGRYIDALTTYRTASAMSFRMHLNDGTWQVRPHHVTLGSRHLQ
jgi:hypothetical protein